MFNEKMLQIFPILLVNMATNHLCFILCDKSVTLVVKNCFISIFKVKMFNREYKAHVNKLQNEMTYTSTI